jgi:hypothetical protein
VPAVVDALTTMLPSQGATATESRNANKGGQSPPPPQQQAAIQQAQQQQLQRQAQQHAQQQAEQELEARARQQLAASAAEANKSTDPAQAGVPEEKTAEQTSAEQSIIQRFLQLDHVTRDTERRLGEERARGMRDGARHYERERKERTREMEKRYPIEDSKLGGEPPSGHAVVLCPEPGLDVAVPADSCGAALYICDFLYTFRTLIGIAPVRIEALAAALRPAAERLAGAVALGERGESKEGGTGARGGGRRNTGRRCCPSKCTWPCCG